MEKSAVFFDIDGTLWNYDKYIPDSTRVAIKKLRENGHLAFICSGRARAFIQDKDLLSLGFDCIIVIRVNFSIHWRDHEQQFHIIFMTKVDETLNILQFQTIHLCQCTLMNQ